MDETNRSLDDKINILELALHGLRKQRNTAALIAQLPPEVLSHVFEFVAADNQPQSPKQRHQWKYISHVCSYWRQVALDCTALWLHIHFNTPQWWVKDMLTRSKKAPLTFEVICENDYKDLSLIWAHIPRIRHLSISTGARIWQPLISEETFPPHANVVADLLHTLILRSTHDLAHCLPMNVFAGGIPLLRQLELHNCNVDWNSPILTGLTSLKLTFEKLSSTRPSMQQMISALKAMPHLEILHLKESVPPTTYVTNSNPHQYTPFSRLSQLEIKKTSMDDCLHLLDQISFPELRSLDLDLENSREYNSGLSEIVSTISRLVNDDGLGARRPFRRFEI